MLTRTLGLSVEPADGPMQSKRIATPSLQELAQLNCLTFILLPSSSVWSQFLIASSIASAVANSTLPHPLDLPVSLSVMTPTYVISPASAKQLLKLSEVVSHPC